MARVQTIGMLSGGSERAGETRLTVLLCMISRVNPGRSQIFCRHCCALSERWGLAASDVESFGQRERARIERLAHNCAFKALADQFTQLC